MKTLIYLVLIVAVATVAFIYLTRTPEVEFTLEEAQKDGTKIARYWLDEAKKGNLANMKAASNGSAERQSENILKEIQTTETSMGADFNQYVLFSMGGGGALKAILSGGPEGDSSILMNLTMIMKEKDGKWCVSSVTIE